MTIIVTITMTIMMITDHHDGHPDGYYDGHDQVDNQSDSQVRMRAVQGAICIASIVQLVIGYTGDCITILAVQVFASYC